MTKNDNGHFTDELKECVFALLTHNVSTSQVSRVIEDVLKLAGLVARDLLCISTIQDWNIMRLLVSQQQLGEVLPQEQHLGLPSDETSTFGQKFEGFHASDPDGRVYVLGMRDIVSKSGQDCLNTFKQILCDIDDDSHRSDEVARKILVKISSTMSDRASTQIKFNDLLEEYRKDILSLTVENYDSMSEAQQLSLGKLCNFFCGLHALVHMAEVASSAAVEADNGFLGEQLPIMNGSLLKAKEPGATRLIRTACKAAAQGGDEKSGCHGTFLEYMRPKLRDNGFHSLPLEPFNILFQNAASVFFLHDDLTIFLRANAMNRLLKAACLTWKCPRMWLAVRHTALLPTSSPCLSGPPWKTHAST